MKIGGNSNFTYKTGGKVKKLNFLFPQIDLSKYALRTVRACLLVPKTVSLQFCFPKKILFEIGCILEYNCIRHILR